MNGENTFEFRDVFSVLEAIGKHSECECFRLGNSFLTTRPVGEDTRKIRDFADPATVVFAFDLYGEVTHGEIVHRGSGDEKSVWPTLI